MQDLLNAPSLSIRYSGYNLQMLFRRLYSQFLISYNHTTLGHLNPRSRLGECSYSSIRLFYTSYLKRHHTGRGDKLKVDCIAYLHLPLKNSYALCL